MKKVFNRLAIVVIHIYRLMFSPSVGVLRHIPLYPRNTCIFYPTCSEYAIQAFTIYSFSIALRKTIGRIGRCHPGNTPAVDYP